MTWRFPDGHGGAESEATCHTAVTYLRQSSVETDDCSLGSRLSGSQGLPYGPRLYFATPVMSNKTIPEPCRDKR